MIPLKCFGMGIDCKKSSIHFLIIISHVECKIRHPGGSVQYVLISLYVMYPTQRQPEAMIPTVHAAVSEYSIQNRSDDIFLGL